MAETSAEIQYALDRRGYVEIAEGASITAPIQLAHLENRPFVKGLGEFTYDGPPGRWAFEWRWDSSYSHDPCSLTFHDILFDRNDVANGGFLQVFPGGSAPRSLSMRRSLLQADEAHAIDAVGVGACESLYFQDMRSQEGSALRWISSSSNGTNWLIIDNWRHESISRVGPTFMFKNLRGIVTNHTIDEQTSELIDALKNVYEGPISLQITNCSGFTLLDEYYYEYSGTFDTNSPDCWTVEIRADEASGSHRMHACELRNAVSTLSGIGTGIGQYHFLGGDSNDGNSLRVDMVDHFKQGDGKTKFKGKVYPVAVRAMDLSEYSTTKIEHWTDVVAGSFRDWWSIDGFAFPYQVYADRINYFGSDYNTNYVAETPQYDA